MSDDSADLDLVLIIDGSHQTFAVRNGQVAPIANPDPQRCVTLTLSAADVERVRAGEINAQQLLHAGALRVGGRLDALQAAAGALSALGLPSDAR